MRILIFSLVYYPRFIGGAEVAVKEITDRIGSDCEFDMITLRKHAPAFEKIGNINVYRVGLPWFGYRTSSSRIFPLSKILYVFLAFFKAVPLHRKNKYDVIWSIMASYAGFAAFLFKKKNKSIPFLLTIQEGDNFGRREGIFFPFFSRIFRSADRIQAISNFLAQWSRKMGAICDIYVVPNGVDFEKFESQNTAKEKEALKKKLGFYENDKIVITVSRLVEKNGIADLISSLLYLPPDIKLLIAGTGPLEPVLKKKVKDSGLEGRIVFVGFISHDKLPIYLSISDVFCRPSISEGLGNSFLEAMASRVPVVATSVGGIADFLRNGENGLVCEVNNPQSIAMQIRLLLGNDAFRAILSRNASRMVKERYRWEFISYEIKKIFLFE